MKATINHARMLATGSVLSSLDEKLFIYLLACGNGELIDNVYLLIEGMLYPHSELKPIIIAVELLINTAMTKEKTQKDLGENVVLFTSPTTTH